MEKKHAVLRLTADGEDRLIIVPVVIIGRSLGAAKREVLKQFENGTAVWIGWVDRYTIYQQVKVESTHN